MTESAGAHHGASKSASERKRQFYFAVLSPRDLFISFVVAGFATGFLFQLDGADDDGFVERLGHVVDGESGNGGSCERLHLDSGLGGGGRCGTDSYSAFDDAGFDVDVGKGKGMAHGDELGGTLGG